MNKGWAAFLMLVCVVPASAWQAYVASTIWRWFAVPIGAPDLSTVRVIGLTLIYGIYKYADPTPSTDDKSGTDLFLHFVGRRVALPAFALLLAYLYVQFL